MHEYVNYARPPLSFRFVDLRALDDSGKRNIFAGRIYSRGGEAILASGDRSCLSVNRIYLKAGRVADDSPRKSVPPYLCHARHLFLSTR